MEKKIVEVPESTSRSAADGSSFKLDGTIRMPHRFAALNRLITRDLNGTNSSQTFYLYSKDKITEFLKNPYTNQKNLRNAAIYIYGASSHFRRLIQYFAGLSDLSYVVSPYKIDTSTAKPSTVGKQYRKTINLLSAMDIKNQFSKVLTVCLREDTFYGTMWVTNDNITIQQLPSDYCDIAVVEGNVLNVSFDFSYFDSNSTYLDLYPEEFRRKYKLYQGDRTKMKWQELDSPTSFAVKCNNDILNYSIPPFVGIFREVYDLEDYKQLKMTKTELENYAMLVMKLGINSDGEWEMDLDKAKEFWRNLDNVLPEEVGSVLTPMPIDKISFDKSNVGDTDTISSAEQNLFTAAGVSSLLFNNQKASSNALLLSVKADQAITFGIVRSIEGVINRFIQSYSYGKNFKVTFLDVSPFNRKEMGDQYLKACQYGLPMVSYYCASQGLLQAEMDCMNFLEDDVLNIKSRFAPLMSSATTSGADGAGRPEKDAGDLSDSGEQSRESDDGDNDE
ncbi:hypothetical protein [Intestinimonas butyriciproducens]|uniref:hypothetical protein n=1 Tax=Intestinimonas butyriciproducens TaxID=1297617 RepID=UPI0018994359|nr:hypothetical protein [Intestinimonas butyriciproducens]MDB7829127.1 hypothetical protein [Intestinimonas butyriciproducens]